MAGAAQVGGAEVAKPDGDRGRGGPSSRRVPLFHVPGDLPPDTNQNEAYNPAEDAGPPHQKSKNSTLVHLYFAARWCARDPKEMDMIETLRNVINELVAAREAANRLHHDGDDEQWDDEVDSRLIAAAINLRRLASRLETLAAA
jgi:hypothetical protein